MVELGFAIEALIEAAICDWNLQLNQTSMQSFKSRRVKQFCDHEYAGSKM